MRAIEAVLRQHRVLSPRPLFYDGTHVWCEGVESARATMRYPELAELLRSWGFRLMEAGVTERWELA